LSLIEETKAKKIKKKDNNIKDQKILNKTIKKIKTLEN
jgi:hypothetical protein